MTLSLPRGITHVLLDLDGTLTDSAPGIIASLRAGFADAGFEVPTDAVLRTFVGPPLGASLAGIGLSAADAAATIAAYRRDFEVRGMFDNSVFAGIPEALTELREAGVTLLVATAKPQYYARKIVGHFGLDGYLEGGLDGVHGAADYAAGEAQGKEVVVERALAHAAALGADVGRTVMVGDREHDVHAAAHHDVPTIGVTWGYAAPGELEAAGA
ncbi:HAD hydrolase-like protein, partial [Promicromonospora sp. NPDC060271]|uniref:HAD hydrolase-like protein n=1 Tax=Promicromonospora sp. NPDC060271 TaxID=3347089 RepID=UPI00365E0B34